jgi:hypothetical protein
MFLLDHLFFLIFIQAFSDKLFHSWGNNCPLPVSRSLVEGHVFALAVLSDSVPGNPQPSGYFPLREPFYGIEFSDMLVLIHFDHLLTS